MHFIDFRVQFWWKSNILKYVWRKGLCKSNTPEFYSNLVHDISMMLILPVRRVDPPQWTAISVKKYKDFLDENGAQSWHPSTRIESFPFPINGIILCQAIPRTCHSIVLTYSCREQFSLHKNEGFMHFVHRINCCFACKGDNLCDTRQCLLRYT